ncbi:MAG: hypothetical protein IKK21_12570 [Clostridia bacterium]|nr:hypothetical protein [Clostridia bacterium]
MEQLNMLWAYQQEDMKADRMANELRRSPTRQKLEKLRAFLIDQQNMFKQIDEKVAQMTDRMDVITDAIPRYEEQLAALQQRIEQDPPADLDAVRALISEVNRCRETISNYEQEMRRIVSESSSHANRQRTIRAEMVRAKQEFEELKAVYDKELKESKAQVDAQRAVAQQKAEGIDPKLMEEYNTIKKHITPPMARLIGDQCGGCNTSLPSAVLRKIKAGTEMIECETCGRMMIP